MWVKYMRTRRVKLVRHRTSHRAIARSCPFSWETNWGIKSIQLSIWKIIFFCSIWQKWIRARGPYIALRFHPCLCWGSQARVTALRLLPLRRTRGAAAPTRTPSRKLCRARSRVYRSRFTTKYSLELAICSLESSRRDLHKTLRCTALQYQFFGRNLSRNIKRIIIAKLCQQLATKSFSKCSEKISNIIYQYLNILTGILIKNIYVLDKV